MKKVILEECFGKAASVDEIIKMVYLQCPWNVETMGRLLQLDGISDGDFFIPENRMHTTILIRYVGKFGQIYLNEIALVRPFIIGISFSVIECADVFQCCALRYSQVELKKSVAINVLNSAGKPIQEYSNHLCIVEKIFQDLACLISRKIKEAKGQVVRIRAQDISFIVPEKLRHFPGDAYSWGDRGNTF